MTLDEIKALAEAIHVSAKYMLKLGKDIADRVLPAIQESIQELQSCFNPSDAVMAERLSHEIARTCKRRSARILGDHDQITP
jgi:hypothetical protein